MKRPNIRLTPDKPKTQIKKPENGKFRQKPTRQILSAKRRVLDAVASLLQEKEVVSGDELDRALAGAPKTVVAG